MLFKDFLLGLVDDMFAAHERAILLSEMFRKSLYSEKDGKLEHKTTKRLHGGQELNIPEKTQHSLHDLLVKSSKMKTGVDVYEKEGKLLTHVKSGLFDKCSHVEIEIEFGSEEPPEGVHAQTDQLNENLKNNLQGGSQGGRSD